MTKTSSTQPNQRHLLIIEDENGQREFALKDDRYSIGRHEKSDIRIYSMFVSRHHATLVRYAKEDGSYYYRIFDGDGEGKVSSTGIKVNGTKIATHDLKNEDQIIFGGQVRASYYVLVQQNVSMAPIPDEFDVTLIMMGDDDI